MSLKKQQFDPALPLKLENANPVESIAYSENVGKIQLNTYPNWWGNALQEEGVKVGSKYAELQGTVTVNNDFLNRMQALAKIAVETPLVKMKVAKQVDSVESVNPYDDRIETTVSYKEEIEGILEDITVSDFVEQQFGVIFVEAAEVWENVPDGDEVYENVPDGDEIIESI